MSLKKLIFDKLVFIVACFFIALTTGNILASNNVLLSPGFEDAPVGQAPAFPPWWEWHDINKETTGRTGGKVTDEASHGGKRSVARYVKGRALGCYAQTIEIVPGEVIDGGVWIKTSKDFSGAQAYLRIEFKDKDSETIQAIESKRIISADEPWKLYTIEASPAPDRAVMAVFCVFLMGKDKDSRGKAWFDDGYMYIKIKGLI